MDPKSWPHASVGQKLNPDCNINALLPSIIPVLNCGNAFIVKDLGLLLFDESKLIFEPLINLIVSWPVASKIFDPDMSQYLNEPPKEINTLEISVNILLHKSTVNPELPSNKRVFMFW